MRDLLPSPSDTAKCLLVFGSIAILLYWPWRGEVGL